MILTLGAFVVFGMISCGLSDRELWEKEIRDGSKLMLEPRDYKDAEIHLKNALDIARRIGAADGEELESLTLPVYWNVLLRLEKWSDAELLLRRNIELDRALHGPDDRDLAYPIGSLAGLLADQQRFPEAKPHFVESLRIEQLNNSSKSFSIADLELGLAEVEIALGDSSTGDSLYLHALSIYRTARHPDIRYQKALESYNAFLRTTSRWAESKYVESELDSVARNIEARKRNRSREVSNSSEN